MVGNVSLYDSEGESQAAITYDVSQTTIMLFRDAIERKRSRNYFEPTDFGIDEEWCQFWAKLDRYGFPVEP